MPPTIGTAYSAGLSGLGRRRGEPPHDRQHQSQSAAAPERHQPGQHRGSLAAAQPVSCFSLGVATGRRAAPAAIGLASGRGRPYVIDHVRFGHQPLSRSDAAPGLRAGVGRADPVRCRDGRANASRRGARHHHRHGLPRLPERSHRWDDGLLQHRCLLDHSGPADPRANSRRAGTVGVRPVRGVGHRRDRHRARTSSTAALSPRVTEWPNPYARARLNLAKPER